MMIMIMIMMMMIIIIIIIINHALVIDFYVYIISTENCHNVLETRDSFYITFMINTH
jgi:hypothetical protein